MTNEKSLKIVYEKSSNYNSYYFNIARGTLVGDYDFKMVLYSDHLMDIELEEKNEKGETVLKPTVSKLHNTVKRKAECEIIMSIKTLVEVRDYLNKIIKNSDLDNTIQK